MPSAAPTCPNCDAPATGAFCAQCGQNNHRERLDARSIAKEFVQNFVGWDSALIHTFRGLVRAPGLLVADYISGRRRRYINPARFCFMCLALWFLVSNVLGVDLLVASGISITNSSGGESELVVTKVREFIENNLNVLMFLSLPLRAVLFRAFFRKSGRNLAECLVLVLYVAGFGYFFGLLLVPLQKLDQEWVVPLRQLLTIVWSVWAARQFFELSLGATTWRVLSVLILHFLGTVIMFAAIALPWVLLR